jgi:hypothetical protein
MTTRPPTAGRLRPTSAATASSRPTTATHSRPLSAVRSSSSTSYRRTHSASGHIPAAVLGAAQFSTTDPAIRIAPNVHQLKTLLVRRPRPLNEHLMRGEDTVAEEYRSAGLDVGAGGAVLGDHLIMHKRTWNQVELTHRVEGFAAAHRERPMSAAMRNRNAGTARFALSQIRDFSRAHKTDVVDEDDDEDDIRTARAEAEAQRKADILAGKKSTPTPGSRPRSRTIGGKNAKASIVQSESVALKYLLMLDRLSAVNKSTVSAAALRRLLLALQRTIGETVTRAGHEVFKAIRKPTFLDRATAAASTSSASMVLTMSSTMQPLTLTSSPRHAADMSTSTAPPLDAAPATPTHFPSSSAPSLALPGAGMAKQEAAAVYAALEVYHEDWVAHRPTLEALRFVCGGRSAVDVTLFVFTAVAAHGAALTPTDLLTIHRYATQCRETIHAKVLGLASLGRGSEKYSHAANETSALAGVTDVAVLGELLRAKAELFSTERESVLWPELVEHLDAKQLVALAAIAHEAAKVR